MRFLRRVAVRLGFLKDEPHEQEEAVEEADHHHHHHHHGDNEQTRRSLPTEVTDRAHLRPVIAPSNLGNGGVQGLKWYANRLRIDEDGDVADEFLEEVFSEVVEMPSSIVDGQRPIPKLQVKYNTRPAKVRQQVMSVDGKLQHNVEYQGRLQWV